MRSLVRGVFAATLAIASLLVAPSASAFAPVDFCQYYPCQEGEEYEIHFLPDYVTHYPCDIGSGQAPAGAGDETADLQAWIDSVPDGGDRRVVLGSQIIKWHVLLFPPSRCIRMDGQLDIHERHYLIFDGGGVTLDQHLKVAKGGFNASGEWMPGIVGWNVWRGSFLQWRLFKIVGNHPEKYYSPTYGLTKVSTGGICHDDAAPQPTCEWQYGWALRGTQHVTLESNETKNTKGESVFIAWDEPDYTVDSRYIKINNHKVYGSGRQGIAGMSGQDIVISNSYIEGAFFNATLFEPESTDNRFPVRRATITNNIFGQSGIGAIFGLTGHCAEVTDISFTHNIQIEPNVSWHAPVWVDAPPAPCVRQHGPVTITHNNLLVEGDDPFEIAGFSRRYSDVTWNSNSVRRLCSLCPTSAATAVHIHGGSGHVLNQNNLAVPGSQPWQWVHAYDSVNHGSLGTNVSSCGNTIAQVINQPNAC